MVIQRLTPDKQEIIEMLLNDETVTMEEASRLAEVSVEEIEEAYHPLCAECGKTMTTQVELERGWCNDHSEEDEEEDVDPRCVCGTYLSEHSMLGCPEGFQTPAEWSVEREAIRERAFRASEDDHLDDFGDTFGYDYYGDGDY